MKFSSIPQFPQSYWQANVDLGYLGNLLEDWHTKRPPMSSVELCSDFQRGHVWSPEQQTAYMEYFLRGGTSGRDIFFNHPGWGSSYCGDFVLVDGLQRITSALAFLNDEIPVFGWLRSEYEDNMRLNHSFIFHVATLKTRAEVLQWYVDFNAGGTPHAAEEIERVRALIAVEEG